jgi:regulator of sirC expression with transglutaminase-like and TPR domain
VSTGEVPGREAGTVAAMDPAERFGSIVRAPEPEIRLDEAAFCIAACARPEVRSRVDVDEWCDRVDALAAASPEPTFEAVRTLLFVTEGFRGNVDDYGDPRNSFLDAVIDRRCGIPISLSVLLIEVARRHGIEVLGIGMPGHFLVREAAVEDRWCDPFHGGARLELLDCARLFAALHGGVRPLQAADLAPTPPRAIIARMLANLEQGRFGTDPGNLATLCALHLAIPGVPVDQQVQLLRALARAGDPQRVERAYAEVAATAPDDIAEELQTEVRLLRSRWN